MSNPEIHCGECGQPCDHSWNGVCSECLGRANEELHDTIRALRTQLLTSQEWGGRVQEEMEHQARINSDLRDENKRLIQICVNVHDRALRGDDDCDLMAMLAGAWQGRKGGKP